MARVSNGWWMCLVWLRSVCVLVTSHFQPPPLTRFRCLQLAACSGVPGKQPICYSTPLQYIASPQQVLLWCLHAATPGNWVHLVLRQNLQGRSLPSPTPIQPCGQFREVQRLRETTQTENLQPDPAVLVFLSVG